MFEGGNIVSVCSLKSELTSIASGGPSILCERQPWHEQASLHIDLGLNFTGQDGHSLTDVSVSQKTKYFCYSSRVIWGYI